MFAFLVLSTGRGFEIKALAIGLAAGIIFDGTVIRALLVPALMRLLGDANWWLPSWMARVLRLPPDEPVRPTSLNRPETAR
jgi:RND superfamily putative drug exporter